MRKAEEIPQIVKHPFPHVIVRDFLDTATLDLVIDGGFCGFEATSVVDLSAETPVVLRKGCGDTSAFES